MKNIFKYSLALVLACSVSCSKNEPATVQDPVGSPILLSAGNTALKSSLAEYMQNGGRFVCKMYFHANLDATDETLFDKDTMMTWLQVYGTQGNSLYQKASFTPITMDTYGDVDAVRFVWKNRLKHAFIALADYNQLNTNDGVTGSLVMPTLEYITRPPYRFFYNGYKIIDDSYTALVNQPDPILAMTESKPAAGTEEGNRIVLDFNHQFSLVQVNLKNAADGSVDIPAGNILSVELLGTAEEAYVTNQVQGIRPASLKDELFPTFYLPYSKDRKKTIEPPYGSKQDMYVTATPATGYLKSFECIAYGDLGGLRIKWISPDTGIHHDIVYKITEANLTPLVSGKRYIYNIELRRSTLSVIRTEIEPWIVGNSYNVNGIMEEEI